MVEIEQTIHRDKPKNLNLNSRLLKKSRYGEVSWTRLSITGTLLLLNRIVNILGLVCRKQEINFFYEWSIDQSCKIFCSGMVKNHTILEWYSWNKHTSMDKI